ncbi:uncharacterized protein LOC122925630 [Bufo gargarizans]|uniref:uncharacterized protein LOC122925630 n=1 Tax=Bufo gargarizans TaxID=30331 RepID=UPI001CF52DDA|nr:uncharacterized protein LOC122925630 [Bufo gargarizans]
MPRWNVDKLICLVQERPELWDTRSRNYQDRVRKDAAWEQVARHMRRDEWAKADGRGCASLVKQTKTRWNSCRDQFRRELNSQGRSGEGGSKKRPYLYTQQLMFLRPVMDLRPTVDSLEQAEDSEEALSGEILPVFSPATSPAPTPALEPDEPSQAEASRSPRSPSPLPQPQPRRRRNVPQTSSGQETREAIDAQVIEFLAQRRSDGIEGSTLRGLGNIFRQVPLAKQPECVTALAMVIHMYSSNYEGDLLTELNELRRRVLNLAPQVRDPGYYQPPMQQPGPSFPQQPTYQRFQGPTTSSSQTRMATRASDPGYVRPQADFDPGPFTRELFDL